MPLRASGFFHSIARAGNRDCGADIKASDNYEAVVGVGISSDGQRLAIDRQVGEVGMARAYVYVHTITMRRRMRSGNKLVVSFRLKVRARFLLGHVLISGWRPCGRRWNKLR